MATFIVTETQDSGAGSLRAAVLAANAATGDDDIVFSSAFDGGAEDLIWLTSGQIEITDGLTITGGPAGVTITGDANGDDIVGAGAITDVAASLDGEDRLDDNSRIFDATADLTIDGLTLTGGRTTASSEAGGAVRGSWSVTLTNSTDSGNSTAGDRSRGGGVWGAYDVVLTNSTVSGNSTAGDYASGGGVWGSYSSVTLTNTTVTDNRTAGDDSEGGGVSSFNYVTLTNSTVSGNSTAGKSSEGGGVWGIGVTLTNSIVLGNTTVLGTVSGDEVGGLSLAGGNIVGGNLFDGDVDVGDVTADEVFASTVEIAPGVRAGLLADNGGPTKTILIKADGPAVDAGGATGVPIDQRGLERVVGMAVDLGAVELGAGPAEPGSLNVTTALDVVANDGLTSLREAVLFANFKPGTDTITFDASVFDGEAGDVIRLTSGQIEITEALTIAGSAGGVTITGDANGDDVTRAGAITDVDASGAARLNDNSRIFDATVALTLDGLTLTGGRTIADREAGGAVRARAATLTNSIISGNSTAGDASSGGGVEGVYGVTLTNSVVSDNRTSGDRSYAGGIHGWGVMLTSSTVSGNSTTGSSAKAGGIYGVVEVNVVNSTVSGNSTAGDGASGGGIEGYRVSLTNSTVSGNNTTGRDAIGGGVYSNYYSAYLINSIVLGNTAAFSGLTQDETAGGLSVVGANILGNELRDGAAVVGTVTAAEVFAATTEIAPGVFAGVLADNGGPTRTIAIRADGPAAGAADPANATATDQRGVARDDAPDLGAFEAGAEDGLKLVGGPRADRLIGRSGDDRIYGKGGNDLLCGLAGDDLLQGGKGRDILKGGDGDDVVFGDTGDDRIGGGAGDDMLSGGRGHDVFVFGPDLGADTIVGFDANPWRGQDRMDLRALGISATSFASAVRIEQIDDDTLITLRGEGSVLCRGIDGHGGAVIDQSDFLLLA
jgi:fibronectin-binding autotransporter adhesin